jgi:cytidyltransferase-like protein
MFINELAEPTLLVIYPGRFQPFHKGHHAVYEHLATKFGRNNVYIATSNKTDNNKSPFTFAEKAYFMQLTGVPADRIVQTTQPYQIESILATGQVTVADPTNTVVIFAVSQKDMEEDPRFSFAAKKDGSAPYFQPLRNLKDTVAMDQHGYIMTVPTFNFDVLGKPMRSSTELRAEYKDANEKSRQAIIADLFGKYTQEAEQIMNAKLAPQPIPGARVQEDAGGVGVVASKKQANDPRYSTSLTKDVRPGQINKSLKAFNLAETDREPYQQSIDRLSQSQIEQLNSLIDEITHRINTEKLPAHYVEALKQRMEKLKAERTNIALGR